jgi:epoxyqueuosine reductase
MKFSKSQLEQIKTRIYQLALEHGFQDARVSDTDTKGYFSEFKQWVDDNYHGDMSYLERNQKLRESPEQLHPNTSRVISLRYDYLPNKAEFTKPLKNSQKANISRYALGKDYHKHLRKKLDLICKNLRESLAKDFNLDYRVFVDSAPVLETAFAEKSGLGWKGKHTLIINKKAGSWFFLGEIFINLPLAIDEPVENLCGSCVSCINLCPTNAIIDDNKIDARRCISYLTIENQGAIPVEYRHLIGNRIYGCDDCQLACPWNRFSNTSKDLAFRDKNSLTDVTLLSLWQWSEKEFLTRFEGSPIRRIGFQNWLRNLAVAIGNSQYSDSTIQQLDAKRKVANNMVNEHIDWAIKQLKNKKENSKLTGKNNFTNQKLIHCVEKMLPRDA